MLNFLLGANRPGAKRLGGRNDQGRNDLGRNVAGAKRLGGELDLGRNDPDSACVRACVRVFVCMKVITFKEGIIQNVEQLNITFTLLVIAPAFKLAH